MELYTRSELSRVLGRDRRTIAKRHLVPVATLITGRKRTPLYMLDLAVPAIYANNPKS
jgi:hypothetical protein